MKKRVVILLTGAAAAALLLAGCTSNPEDSIFDPNSGMPAISEPLDDVSYEEEFHPEDWIEYDEEGEPILPDGVEKSDVFDDNGDDDSWVEDSEDSDDEDEDDGVELWNGTGEWNGY